VIPSNLIASLRARGFRLAVVDGSLRVSPASALTPRDREAIRATLPAVLTTLGVIEPWDGETALRLMEEADARLERSGVDGNRPEIAAAAAVVVSAHATRDMETLRFALSEFLHAVRLADRRCPSMPNE
jgi:hypothetical protein